MVLEVSGGAVGSVSVETNGGGPLGHPVSSASVSRSSGSQKSIFSGKFCKNQKDGHTPSTAKELRKGKYGPNLTTEISKSEIFDFPKLAPGRSWGNAGMVGHAETCSKHTAARPRLAPRSLTCTTLSRQSMGMTRE